MVDPNDPPRLCHWPSWPLPFGLDLERSPPDVCPYLEDRTMRVRGFACDWVSGASYQRLLDAGFRRSGRVFYQPACDGCRQCTPLRVPVATFRMSRSQARVARRNRDLAVSIAPPQPSAEKHALYVRYLEAVHDGSMAADRRSFEDFLHTPATETVEFSYRTPDRRLVGLGFCDLTPLAVSSVYFAYEPDQARRSLGTFSGLMEIDFARHTARSHLYLGYWVDGCAKMAYKRRFAPCEALGADGVWRPAAEELPSGGDGVD